MIELILIATYILVMPVSAAIHIKFDSFLADEPEAFVFFVIMLWPIVLPLWGLYAITMRILD